MGKPFPRPIADGGTWQEANFADPVVKAGPIVWIVRWDFRTQQDTRRSSFFMLPAADVVMLLHNDLPGSLESRGREAHEIDPARNCGPDIPPTTVAARFQDFVGQRRRNLA